MSEIKKCPKCKTEKPVSMFSRDRSQSDGLQSRCKACSRESHARWLKDHGEQMKQAQARWRASNRGYTTMVARLNPSIHRERARKYRLEHPDRVKAHNAARCIESAPCERCGAAPSEKHHPDYSKPKLIIHLCKKCHVAEHQSTA